MHVQPLLLPVLIALGACGASDTRAPAESRAGGGAAPADDRSGKSTDIAALDACALLPPAEIPARFGAITEGPKLTRDPNGWPTCWYVVGNNVGLVVELIEGYMYDINRKVWDPKRVQDVSGVGDKAYLVALKPPSDPYLVAAKGDVAVKVTTRNLELGREAARAVLRKL